MNALYLVVGGAMGTLARYYVSGWFADLGGPKPLGIFVVNIAGAFLIGLFLTLGEERFLSSAELRLLIAVGFLGAFTTFSTLTWDSLQLAEARDVAGAIANTAGSLAVGMLAVYAGAVTARVL
ncbi:MAG TPA: fluoride efflux transporter CrcB [Dehalococcoidia bacterium]|jgi:CrcB protein|nr:fluoride efflux transporter CrcB [Dehalococcoidia bacterium]